MAIACALLAAGGCAHEFPLPMTAAELAAYDSGDALVAYLGQTDASPTVCDLRATGPHLSTVDDDARRALVRGLGEGEVTPELWRRCADALVRSSAPGDASALVDAVGRGYRTLIRNRGFEREPELQARLAMMQRFYIERRHGVDGNAAVDDKLFAELRRALARHRLGPVAAPLADELVATYDLEHGLWQGHAVDLATIDKLHAAGDENTLERFANRLPDDRLCV